MIILKNSLRAAIGCSFIAATATQVSAGGIQRSDQSVGLLFEQGNVARMSLAYANPSISGTDSFIGAETGNMAKTVAFPTGGVKWDQNETLSFALLYDQPFGAKIGYDEGFFEGTEAFIQSNAITALARYKLGNGFSVHGGLRFQTLDAGLTQVAGGTEVYDMDIETSQGIGGSIGFAYEIPERLMRVSLTYNSKVKHKYDDVRETVLGTPSVTSFETETPQSVNLELQSALSPTLIGFARARWVDWSEYDISPTSYVAAFGQPLDSYPDDTISYEIGAVKVFNPKWFGVASVTREAGHDRPTSALGPFKGYTALTLAAVHNVSEEVSMTYGARYIKLGDTSGGAGTFKDNDVLALSLSMDYRF